MLFFDKLCSMRSLCVCVVSERWRESCSDGDLQDQKVAMKSVKWREDWATPICDVYCDTEHAVLTWNNCSGHSNLKLRVVCSSDSLATCCCLSAAVGDDTRTWGHTSQLWIHTHAFPRFSRNETIRTVHRMLSSVKTVCDFKPFWRYELSKRHRPRLQYALWLAKLSKMDAWNQSLAASQPIFFLWGSFCKQT